MSKPGHLRRSKSPSVTDRAKEDGGGVCRSQERKIEVRDRERGGREASARQESGISGLVCLASQFRSAMRYAIERYAAPCTSCVIEQDANLLSI